MTVTGVRVGLSCPKCGRSRADHAAACPRCGLVFERWGSDQALQAAALDDEAQAMYREIKTRWNDEALHDAFLKHCSAKGCLGAAGHKYRDRLDRDPKDAVALKMQARIVTMAAAVLAPIKSTPPRQSNGRWFWWVIAFGAVGGAVAGVFLRRLGN
jgi:hypothetical protein